LEDANTNPGINAAQTKWQHMQMGKWDLTLFLTLVIKKSLNKSTHLHKKSQLMVRVVEE